MPANKGWIGVDADGTLYYYDGWKGEEHLGALIEPMAERVRYWLANGIEVRIVTARATPREDGGHERAIKALQARTLADFGQALKVTNQKDYGMIALYDDRAVGVEENTGRLLNMQQRDDDHFEMRRAKIKVRSSTNGQ